MRSSYTDKNGVAHWTDCFAGSQEYYGIEWANWLTNENDTLTGVTWTLPNGLTQLDAYNTTTLTAIKIGADEVGEHEVSCTIDTIENSDTQKVVQKIILKVK